MYSAIARIPRTPFSAVLGPKKASFCCTTRIYTSELQADVSTPRPPPCFLNWESTSSPIGAQLLCVDWTSSFFYSGSNNTLLLL